MSFAQWAILVLIALPAVLGLLLMLLDGFFHWLFPTGFKVSPFM